ncbi:TolB-like 6-bladed beta-propeller domain-containing protein [Algoriphagus namhaensis]
MRDNSWFTLILVNVRKGLSFLTLTSLVILFGSCKKDIEVNSLGDFFHDVDVVSIEQIPFEPKMDGLFFVNLYFIGYIDSVLVINEFLTSDYTFKLVDLKTGEVKNFGKRGEGPNELISEGGHFLLDHDNNKLTIGDGFSNYVYSVNNLFDDNPLPLSSYSFETGDDRFMGHRTLAKGRVVGSTHLKRFATFCIENGEFETYEDYPGGVAQSLAHQAYFASHPTEFRVAYGMRDYPEFGIITEKKQKVEIKKWSWGDNINQVQELADGTKASVGSIEDELHFFSAAASKKSIFFLHSGKKERLPDGRFRKKGLLPDQVYQLDWEGNPKAILKLGQPVKAIAVDPDGKFLFASSSANDPELLIYKLPDHED